MKGNSHESGAGVTCEQGLLLLHVHLEQS
jgi:hypothetical protein